MTMTLTEVPEWVESTPEAAADQLLDGGRLLASVRSRKTGNHVTILLIARKKKPTGKGFVPRNTEAGKVGFRDADVLEARDPDREYPDNYVGRFYRDNMQWRAGKEADAARAWTADRLIAWALSGQLLEMADVRIATQCCVCGKRLTHPESVERGIGPECGSQRTIGKAAPHA